MSYCFLSSLAVQRFCPIVVCFSVPPSPWCVLGLALEAGLDSMSGLARGPLFSAEEQVSRCVGKRDSAGVVRVGFLVEAAFRLGSQDFHLEMWDESSRRRKGLM